MSLSFCLKGSFVEYRVLIGYYFPSNNFQLREIPGWQKMMVTIEGDNGLLKPSTPSNQVKNTSASV